METVSFTRFAGLASIFVAVGALLYAILFIAIVEGAGKTTLEFWFFLLMLGGIGTIPVLVAVYQRLREVDPGFALTAFILGLLAAFGGILHGGYNLGGNVTPPEAGWSPGQEEVAHGILRYGVAGLALLLLGWLIQHRADFPRGLAYLAYLGGAALVFIYIGRLYDFIEPGNYVSLIPPIVYGFAIHPLFYGWLGLLFWRSPEGALVPART
jgi:hypothetical protein